MTDANAPIDGIHSESTEFIASVRKLVADLKNQAANWQPGPMPQEWGTYQSTHHRRMK